MVQLLLTTVSNDEKPMSFLHSNVSFGTLIRKQAFHTRLFRIFLPFILVPHFLVPHFPPLQSGGAFSCPVFFTPDSLTVPHFSVSHFQSSLDNG